MTHRWDHDNEQRIAASEFADGNGRNLRACKTCGMVKVTVIPPHGIPWNEWRMQDGTEWLGEATPPCVVKEPVEVPIL